MRQNLKFFARSARDFFARFARRPVFGSSPRREKSEIQVKLAQEMSDE